VALARQALDDDERARQALEAALAVAPAGERPTYRQHLAALSLNAAQALLARAGSHETEDRVGALRAALTWVERGLAQVPADERLRAAAETARDALWPAYEQTVTRLLQRQEFETARRLLREALDDLRLPSAWVGEFQELLSGTFGGEIGQLTAQAIRSMQEERESEALGALQRAEELLATIAAEALPPKRREEVDQRLWWGYTRLGMRRVDAGEYEEALDPLVHALRFADIGPDRQAETRAALVRALEGVAELRALGIRQLNDDGNRDEAVLRTEALRELLRSCMVLGVSEEELSVAFAKARRLGEELGMEDHA
jgi:tetratricopeptide (TPR) repeat protein